VVCLAMGGRQGFEARQGRVWCSFAEQLKRSGGRREVSIAWSRGILILIDLGVSQLPAA
jgi:hypothetical protein